MEETGNGSQPEYGAIPPAFQRAPLLTKQEQVAIQMLAALHELMGKEIIGSGPARWSDHAEMTHHIHILQHMVMSQAAARAFPGQLRLLGEGVAADEEEGTGDAAGAEADVEVVEVHEGSQEADQGPEAEAGSCDR